MRNIPHSSFLIHKKVKPSNSFKKVWRLLKFSELSPSVWVRRKVPEDNPQKH